MVRSRVLLGRGSGFSQGRGSKSGVLRSSLLLGLLALVFASGCRDVTVGEPRDLSITLDSQPATGTVGDSVVFLYEAEGRALLEIRISFGDGVVDTIPTFLAQTAGGERAHTYQEAGQFEVVAVVEEASGQMLSTSLILPVAGPRIR